MLTATGLSVTLSRRTVLRDITFTARPGAVTSIIGPNGSGKSTLLKALSGELRYNGRASLNGHEIVRTSARVLSGFRAVLAQDTQVAFPFTVAEIVRMGMEAGPGAADADLPAQLLAEMDLTGYGQRRYHELSGGEQARVQLARVMAQVRQPVALCGPAWLFLDEPVASLDIAHQLLVMRLARNFADAGGGVVMVLHDLNLTAMLSDHVLLLRAGSIIADGSVDQVIKDVPLSRAYGCALRINALPRSGPWILPQPAGQLSPAVL